VIIVGFSSIYRLNEKCVVKNGFKSGFLNVCNILNALFDNNVECKQCRQDFLQLFPKKYFSKISEFLQNVPKSAL